ncbi:c-type cytochrome [bacterium]|nr:c-type cytochrome [bacterium]
MANLASANPHPPIPPQAVSHSDAGKALFNSKCASCHTGGAASNPKDILTAANPNMWDLFSQYPANYPASMVSTIASLTPQQLDDLSVYLADQDSAYYTLQGKVTQNGSPLSGVTVTLTTEYKMGTNLYFPAQQTLTDGQGKFSFKTWAGRKALSVSKTGYNFLPNHRSNIGLSCDIGDFGTYSQGSIQVTGSHGPDGPILSGEIFQTLQFYKTQVSKNLPWLLNSQP